MDDQRLSPSRQLYDKGMRLLVWLCAGLTCALLAFLIGYIFCRGVPGLTWELLSGQTSYIKTPSASCPIFSIPCISFWWPWSSSCLWAWEPPFT